LYENEKPITFIQKNMIDKNISIHQYLLAMMRIYLGVILLITDIGKLTDTIPFSDSMLGFLNAFASREDSFYVHFVPTQNYLVTW